MEQRPPLRRRDHGVHRCGHRTGSTSAVHVLGALAPDGRLLPAGDGVTRPYSVEVSGCFSSSLPTQDGVVLSAAPTTDEATFLRSLTPGESIDLSWSLGIAGVTNAVGGDRILVANGHVALGPRSGAVCSGTLAPRSGITADGRVLDRGGRRPARLVVRDVAHGARAVHGQQAGGRGRHEPGRRGLEHHGRPRRAREPSRDGFERAVSSAVLVFPGGRPLFPDVSPFGGRATLGSSARLVVQDP